MGLIACCECKNPVSEAALSCPHCGFPVGQRDRLVLCPHCKVDVVPFKRSHNQITKLCPRCERPVTGMKANKIVLGVWLGLVIVPVIISVIVVVVVLALVALGVVVGAQ